MEIRLIGRTDVGLQRELNEDYFGILEDERLVVVCDGMGGHAAGEIASQNAVDTIIRLHRTREYPSEGETAFDLPGDFSPEGKFLASTVRVANSRIYRSAQSAEELSGMGTTVVAAILHHNRISICHVGDSRAYRIKNGVLRQLTEDHSWVNELITAGQISSAEARDFPNRNVITRALGVRERVKVDLREESVGAGDMFLFCTDGLVSCLSDEDILEIISAGGDNIEKIVDDLIAGANSGGGDDNITCVVVKVLEAEGSNDDSRTFVSMTFPEESDSEVRAQTIISDALDEETVETESPQKNEAASPPVAAEPEPRNRTFIHALVAFLMILAVVYGAYAFDIAGAKGLISGWLGLD